MPLLRANQGVDLHLHTTASDGYWTPDTLIPAVREKEIDLIAVTDHDSVTAIDPVTRAAHQAGVAVLPAVEFTASFSADTRTYFHLLAYGIDPADSGLAALLADVQQREHDRVIAALEWLRRSGSIEGHGPTRFTEDEVNRFLGRAPLMHAKLIIFVREYVRRVGLEDVPGVYRPPVFRAMQEVGAFTATDVATIARVTRPQKAILIVAHPRWWMREYTSLAPSLTRSRLAELLATGLVDGLEVYSSKHTGYQTAYLRNVAQRGSLIISCGSDSHREVNPPPTRFEVRLCRELLERCGVQVVA